MKIREAHVFSTWVTKFAGNLTECPSHGLANAEVYQNEVGLVSPVLGLEAIARRFEATALKVGGHR